MEYEDKETNKNVTLTCSRFNKPIDNKLPTDISNIILGWDFNQSVDNLPLTLKNITFGHNFNQPVYNLPFTLETIIFGYCFNQPIENLPNSIKSISLGHDFNKLVDDLPNTLEKLFLGKSFNLAINNLPISLIELTIKSRYERYDIYRLPKNIKKITFIHGEPNEYYVCFYGNNSLAKEIYTIDNIKYKFCHEILFY